MNPGKESPLRFVLLILLLFWNGLAGAAANHAIRAFDDRGREVVLPGPAARIVSLAPHVTELAFAAGAGSRLAAVTAYSDYPEAAKNLPSMGDFSRLDLERIIRLKPDLVIGWASGNHAGDLAQLEKLGFKVFATEPRRLADIPRLLRTIGKLAGTGKEAEAAAVGFERELAGLENRYAAHRPVSVFYQIWHEPPMTVNGEHLISDVIALCGGKNIFAKAVALTPIVSAESVLAADPEAIVASGALSDDDRLWQGWRRFPRLKAVTNGNLFFISPDFIQRPTPRVLAGARQMCEKLERVREKP